MKLIIFISLLTIAFYSNISSAEVLLVGPAEQYQSIKAALRACHKGDTLLIRPGYYRERNIVIDKTVTLTGIDYPVVDGENEGEVFTIKADSVTIQGLQIQNVGTDYLKDEAGINIVNSAHCRIINNRLYNTFFGVYLQKSKNCLVKDNQIKGEAEAEISSGNAVHSWYCQNIKIQDNVLSHHRDGIYLEFVDQAEIIGNQSVDNLRYGLHFMFSNHNSYFNNTFSHNGAGVAVMFSKEIEMRSNTFSGNWGPAAYGLLLKEIYDSEITGNLFTGNTTGIYAEGATRCTIRGNQFKSNGWAMKMLGSSLENQIRQNNFIANTFDLSTNSSRNSNIYINNYWSEYNGYDLDQDGYGDVPYRPVDLFSYVVNRVSPSIILLRSLLVDLINFAEKVTPALTPESLTDPQPLMKPIRS